MIFTVEFVLVDPDAYDQDDSRNYAVKLTLRGSLSIDNASELSLLLSTFAKGGLNLVALNAEHLTYIDSTGIGALIRAKKNLLPGNGDLVLLKVPPKVNEVFELVNLKEFIKIFYSDQKAMEHLLSLRRQPQGEGT